VATAAVAARTSATVAAGASDWGMPCTDQRHEACTGDGGEIRGCLSDGDQIGGALRQDDQAVDPAEPGPTLF